jgi:hypothetical protein
MSWKAGDTMIEYGGERILRVLMILIMLALLNIVLSIRIIAGGWW